MTRIFLDATTLISLGTIGELDLLTNFDGGLVVLPPVQDEISTETARTTLTRFIETHEIHTDDPEIFDHIHRAKNVFGESVENGDVHLIAAVIAYTADGRSVGLVSDDQRVRTVGRGLGATVTGTIGVIIRAVDEGLPPQDARELVDRVDAHGLHMTASLREKAYSRISDAADTTIE